MTEHRRTPPLTRRVPGASGSGPGASARTVLPDTVLRRMQAAVDAARGADPGDDADLASEAEPVPVFAEPQSLSGQVWTG
jgi:hypothetical protein